MTVLEAADEIGGGTRTKELTVPGVLHDVCAAVHPFGVASPFLASLPLAEHGLQWRWPEIDLAHPSTTGRPACSAGRWTRRSRGWAATAMHGGAASVPWWRDSTNWPLMCWDRSRGIPSHPLRMARFGQRAGLPATVFNRRFRTEQARALFAGCAAHIFRPLNRPVTASVGTMMIAAGHRHGWPVAEGGTRAITDALAGLLRSLGGTIETGVEVTSLAQLPSAQVTMFDTAPGAFAQIRGSPTGAPRPLLPALPAWPGGVQARPRRPGRRPVDGEVELERRRAVLEAPVGAAAARR